MPQQAQAMGGRNGGVASAGGTGACGPADPCPLEGMNATNTQGTVITAVDVARQWHAVWQQSPCCAGMAGAEGACVPADAIIAPWQCGASFATCACDCETCMWLASVIKGAPDASAVHASSAKASVRRKIGAFGRDKQNMWGA
jgi:hypothetical protein